MLELRPHQQEVVEQLKQGFKQGHIRQLLYASTGFGKTEVAMEIMRRVSEGYKKAAMIVDRIVLVDQTSARLSKYGIEHGVMQSALSARHCGHLKAISVASAVTSVR